MTLLSGNWGRRPIRLRAWDKAAKVMSDPFSFPTGLFYTTDDDGVHFGESEGFTSLNDNLIFLESSGLYDKKEQEIWEGDLIRGGIDPRQVSEVTFYKGMFLFDFGRLTLGNFPLAEIEVVGNVYKKSHPVSCRTCGHKTP